MKKMMFLGLAGLFASGSALANEPAPKPMQCCCEKMKQEGKDCCPKKEAAPHHDHGDHATEKPNG